MAPFTAPPRPLTSSPVSARGWYVRNMMRKASGRRKAATTFEQVPLASVRQLVRRRAVQTVDVTETRRPGMSVVEMCRVLRRDRLTREIPIIVVTADGLPNSISLAHAAGADAVLIKPCLPHQLHAEIERLLAACTALRERSL